MTGATNFFEMSDDDILNMSGPPVVEDQGAGAETIESAGGADTLSAELGDDTLEGGQGTDTIESGGADTVSGAGVQEADTLPGAGGADTVAGTEGADTVSGAAADDKTSTDPKAAGDKDKKDPKDPSGSQAKPAFAMPSPEEATAFFMKIMTPFKANGKTIELKTPEEAIQLMQMGANYTRKMQDIQPHRKMLLMLQNNGLLDEGKLSYLIDLDKKNPEAIKKLIQDSGIDPLEIDTTKEAVYTPGNHQVSDAEAGFRAVLDEMVSTETGQETVKAINETWDQTSKEALWASPEIMSVIHSQRENGVYAKIVEEMDRRRMLGQIPTTTPFLQAYKAIGDQLAEAGAFGSLNGAGTGANDQGKPTNARPEPEIVATRAAAPKSPVANEDKANAASTTRTTSRKAEKLVNPLAMSDEEFMKLDKFHNRV